MIANNEIYLNSKATTTYGFIDYPIAVECLTVFYWLERQIMQVLCIEGLQ